MTATIDPIPSAGETHTPAVVAGVLALMWSRDDQSLDARDVLAAQNLDLGHFTADGLVEILTAAQALICRAEAIQLTAVEELRRRRGDDRDTADEVGLALAVSKHAADRHVHLARQLSGRFPKVLAAMGRGELDAYKASRIVETALPLADDLARQIDDDLDGRLPRRDASAIQQSVRYRVNRLDPDGAARRAERRRLDRKVEFLPGEDGMADLIAYLPAEVASAAYSRIDTIAKSVRTRQDQRTPDEIRADVFADLLLGKHQSNRGVEIRVTVPVTTLLGATDLPAHLTGYGWIPATIAREMAADPTCTWRRLLCDPADGQLLDVGRTRYKPPAQLDDYVRARDQHCRVPGCRRPAQRCDIDHNHDWNHGGHTAEHLLCCLCRRHHRLKDRPGWNYTLCHGELIITTPTGRTYRSTPPPTAQPEPEPPTSRDQPPPF